MTDLWIVLVEDRHSDVDALPFSTEDEAAEYARSEAEEIARRPGDVQEVALTPQMRSDGWVLCLSIGSESDGVRVIKRTLDATI